MTKLSFYTTAQEALQGADLTGKIAIVTGTRTARASAGGGQWQGLGQRRLCPATAAPLPSPNQLLLLLPLLQEATRAWAPRPCAC